MNATWYVFGPALHLAPLATDLPDTVTMSEVDMDLTVPCTWDKACPSPAEWRCRAIHEGEESPCLVFLACSPHKRHLQNHQQRCVEHLIDLVIDFQQL